MKKSIPPTYSDDVVEIFEAAFQKLCYKMVSTAILIPFPFKSLKVHVCLIAARGLSAIR